MYIIAGKVSGCKYFTRSTFCGHTKNIRIIYMTKKIGLVLAVIVLVGGAWIYAQNKTHYSVSSVSGKQFSSSVQGLPEAGQTETVELKNGDTYNLVAEPVVKEINGAKVRMLAYNGSVPGPTIRVAQGAEVTIRFTNKIDIPTTIHSHGVRLNNAFDGVPGVTQPEVKPGESFDYKIAFPDSGVFWYHPHLREDYTQDLGLYGNFIVAPKEASEFAPVNREIPVVLDDILMKNGTVAPYFSDSVDHALMGRYGNVMLVNGSSDYILTAQAGEVIRMYITNAAGSRVFRFGISGAKLKLVGSDNGAYEREQMVDTVTLGPSERAMVDVYFAQAGQAYLENRMPDETVILGKVAVSSDAVAASYKKEFETLRVHTSVSASMNPFRASLSKAPDKTINLTVAMGGMSDSMNMGGMSGAHTMSDGSTMSNSMMMNMAPVGPDGIEWEDKHGAMNSGSTSKTITWKVVDTATNASNMDIHWQFKKGDMVKVRVTNDMHSMHPMQHPFHFHGQRFLVASVNDKPQTNLAWKDTVLIPAGTTVDLLVDMSNPGDWMAHCHIPEHLESGMMLGFKVD